jgi:hypothetical protein
VTAPKCGDGGLVTRDRHTKCDGRPKIACIRRAQPEKMGVTPNFWCDAGLVTRDADGQVRRNAASVTRDVAPVPAATVVR